MSGYARGCVADCSRAAYVASYISIEDHKKSFVRSSFYAVGAGLTFYQIYKAAVLLG
jgi:hypothetical protein